jgi:hypothetical protein
MQMSCVRERASAVSCPPDSLSDDLLVAQHSSYNRSGFLTAGWNLHPPTQGHPIVWEERSNAIPLPCRKRGHSGRRHHMLGHRAFALRESQSLRYAEVEMD